MENDWNARSIWVSNKFSFEIKSLTYRRKIFEQKKKTKWCVMEKKAWIAATKLHYKMRTAWKWDRRRLSCFGATLNLIRCTPFFSHSSRLQQIILESQKNLVVIFCKTASHWDISGWHPHTEDNQPFRLVHSVNRKIYISHNQNENKHKSRQWKMVEIHRAQDGNVFWK